MSLLVHVLVPNYCGPGPLCACVCACVRACVCVCVKERASRFELVGKLVSLSHYIVMSSLMHYLHYPDYIIE